MKNVLIASILMKNAQLIICKERVLIGKKIIDKSVTCMLINQE